MGKAVVFENEGGPLATLIVRPIFKGDAFGLDHKLIYEADEPQIEFYDPNHAYTDLGDGLTGQFINRWPLSILEGHGREGMDLFRGVKKLKLTAAGFAKAMIAISEELTEKLAPEYLSRMDTSDILDVLQDLAHESADEADIPAGPDRDDFIAKVMEPFFNGDEETDESALKILRSLKVPADKIRPIMQDAAGNNSPSP